MSKFPSEAIEAALAKVDVDGKRMMKLEGNMLRAYGGAFYGLDFLANAAVNRSLALSSGFRTMIREKNLICAGALVRLQLDTALRLFAGFIVDEPHEFAMKVFKGNRIDRMKDKDGNRMTDRYLVTQLANEYPWVEEVYERASNYVHLSATHIFSTLSKIDPDAGKYQLEIGSHDRTFPDEVYIDAINAFRACTLILAEHVHGWIFTKDNPEKVAQMRQNATEQAS